MSTTLIVPGLHGSGAEHWQTWFEQMLPETLRVEQDDWETPDLLRWSGKVRRSIDQTSGKLWVVAHSFGCLATVNAVWDRRERIAGLMLVAPADPAKFNVACWLPDSELQLPTVVVASTTDPWVSLRSASYWADRWGARLVNVGNAGHINIDSGHGPWPEGLRLYHTLRNSTVHTPSGDIPDDTELSPRTLCTVSPTYLAI